LNYQLKKIYFPADYIDQINENNLGSPLKELLSEGWTIEFDIFMSPLPTKQNITVEITT